MKILINVPSNRPKYFDQFYNSLLDCEKFHSMCSVHVIAQEPWTLKQMAQYPHVVFSAAVVEEIPSMLDLRRRSIDLAAKLECDYILFIDDDVDWYCCDFYYTSALDVLKTLKCPVLNIYGKSHVRKHIITTNRGLFIKTSALLEFDAPYGILGGCEEPVLAYHAMRNRNELHAKRHWLHGSPMVRNDPKVFDDPNSPMHSRALCEEGCLGYVKRTYNDPLWDVLTGEDPKGL